MAGVRRTQYYNLGPPKDVPRGAPQDVVKAEFARRLQKLMAEAGLNQTEAARLATRYMPADPVTKKQKEFTRDNLSNYVRGLVLPRPDNLHALCQLFNCKPEDLIAPGGVQSAGSETPPLDVRDIGGGRVWLKVNQTVEWDTALQIMNLLKRGRPVSSPPESSAKK